MGKNTLIKPVIYGCTTVRAAATESYSTTSDQTEEIQQCLGAINTHGVIPAIL